MTLLAVYRDTLNDENKLSSFQDDLRFLWNAGYITKVGDAFECTILGSRRVQAVLRLL